MKQYISLGILLELCSKDCITAQKLAAKFEISTRTVYRYLSEFESAGIPTITKRGKGGGVSIIKTSALESMLLTPEDKALLSQAISTLSAENQMLLESKLRLNTN